MPTYAQWATKRTVRRVTWACGAEPVLVHDVLAAYAPIVPGQQAAVFAAELPESALWDALLADPPPGGRLVTVYGAERLKDLAAIEALVHDGADTAWTVLVSAEPDFRKAEPEGGGKPVLVPGLAALQGSRAGQLIRCCRPSDPEAVVRLAASWWPGAGPNHGSLVLDLSGGDLTAAWHACDKARRAGLKATPEMARLACDGGPGRSLADLVIAGEKRAAIAQARRCRGGEVGGVLALLAARLNALEVIGEARRSGLRAADIIRKHHVDPYLLHILGPHAEAYDAARIARGREVLARLEAAWRAGAVQGVPESLVALW
jgi:hypothetical protein